jgi:hypothetical protein
VRLLPAGTRKRLAISAIPEKLGPGVVVFEIGFADWRVPGVSRDEDLGLNVLAGPVLAPEFIIHPELSPEFGFLK